MDPAATTAPFIRPHPQGLALRIRVQPRSSRNKVAGLYGGALKVAITAPPVEGRANSALIDFLAASLDLPKSAFEVIAGQRARQKQLLLHCTPGERPRLTARLLHLAAA